MHEPIRLHLGCGFVHLPGRWNADLDGPAADLRSRAAVLPFRDESVTSVEAYHLLEHLGWLGTLDALAEWHRVLVPAGAVIVETPDVEPSFRRFLAADDRRGRAEALNWICGHETPGHAHLFLFPREALAELLERQGFTDLRFLPARTHHGLPGYRLEARRGGDQAHRLCNRLRAELAAAGGPGTTDQPSRLELEPTLYDELARAVRQAEAGDWNAAAAGLRATAVVSAEHLARFARLARRLGWPPAAQLPALPAAEALAAAGWSRRLWQHLACRAAPRDGHDAFSVARTAGLELVQRVEAAPDSAARLLDETWPGHGDPELPVPDDGCLTRAGVLRLVRTLRARAARARHHGDAATAERLLRRAQALGAATVEPEPGLLSIDLSLPGTPSATKS
jgi:hypothetical protein